MKIILLLILLTLLGCYSDISGYDPEEYCERRGVIKVIHPPVPAGLLGSPQSARTEIKLLDCDRVYYFRGIYGEIGDTVTVSGKLFYRVQTPYYRERFLCQTCTGDSNAN